MTSRSLLFAAFLLPLSVVTSQSALAQGETPAAEKKPAPAPAKKPAPAPAKKPAPAPAPAEDKKPDEPNPNPVVVIETSAGPIEVELFQDKAPKSVQNFLTYMNAKHYDGTVFHRVIRDFMIQGGGYDQNYERKPTRDPIENEAGNGLKNTRGTLAAARTRVVDSATAQWYINVRDNPHLDHTSNDSVGFGYAVFGQVLGDGMNVVDKIANSPTGACGTKIKHDCPETPVVITAVHAKETAP